MRKRPRPYLRTLRPRKIYLDQIERVVSLLDEHCERLLLISGDFEYDSLQELLDGAKEDRIRDLTIHGEVPWVGVAIKSDDPPYLEAEGGSPASVGLAKEVVEILESGPRTINRASSIYLKRRADAPNIVQRNKDQLFLVVVGAIIGAAITQIANLLFG